MSCLPAHWFAPNTSDRYVQDDRKYSKDQRRTLDYDLHGEVTWYIVSHMSQVNALPPEPAAAEPREPEPRWPAVLAILATAGLHFVIPAPLRFGQEWLLLVIVSVLLVPTIITYQTGLVRMNRIFAHIVLGVLTASMIWSLGLLVWRLPSHADPPQELLRAAAALSLANSRSRSTSE